MNQNTFPDLYVTDLTIIFAADRDRLTLVQPLDPGFVLLVHRVKETLNLDLRVRVAAGQDDERRFVSSPSAPLQASGNL